MLPAPLVLKNTFHNESIRPHRSKNPTVTNWTKKYGTKHRWQRITEFPLDVAGPKRVRIYRRSDHYILQWWEPAAKRNLSERVDGDLVSAIARARRIDERLEHFKRSGNTPRRMRHSELVQSFIADLNRRADAGQIDPKTVVRYRSALGHYLTFAEQQAVSAAYPSATNVDRKFALQFSAYLGNSLISPNGHPNSQRRRMISTRYIQDVVRSVFHWAADPERGGLFPDGFRNPFVSHNRQSLDVASDLFGEPDVTLEMAATFLASCDRFQLPLFSLIVLYGLRPSEPCFLFRENHTAGWLKIGCDPALGYVTKGRRDKRLPLLRELSVLLDSPPETQTAGLMFVRRPVAELRESPLLQGTSQEDLRTMYAQRCGQRSCRSAADRLRIRDQLFREVGGLCYDHIEHEFRRIARQLHWTPSATLKDFRHLFSTTLQNAGMPEFYMRYLMGHSPGREAIVAYSHLNELRERYQEAVERELRPLVTAVTRQAARLGFQPADGPANKPGIIHGHFDVSAGLSATTQSLPSPAPLPTAKRSSLCNDTFYREV